MEDRILEYLDAIEAALAQHGDQIADTMIMWARVDAAIGLVKPLIFFILSGIMLIACAPRCYKAVRDGLRFQRERDKVDYRGSEWRRLNAEMDATVNPAIAYGFVSFFAFMAFIPATIGVVNVWRWVGIFYPEMWIIHKAMTAVGG